MKSLKYGGLWFVSLLVSIVISFFLQRQLGLLSATENFEDLLMRIAAWPLLIWAGIAALGLTVQIVRADVNDKKNSIEKKQVQQLAEQAQKRQTIEKTQQEFAIALTGAQLTTSLFDQTNPLAYYMNPLLEQLKPYGQKPKGVFAPATRYFDLSKSRPPTLELRFVMYLQELSDKLVWPFRFPALHKDYVYKGLGRMWGEPQQRIPQFITLPKTLEIKEPERVSAIERGEWDPAIPPEFSRDDTRPLDVHPPLWRWHWRYFSELFAYLNYEKKKPLTEFHYQFAHAGGYDSINNAFTFIENNPPAKTDHPMVWTLAVDAPQFVAKETDRNANDSGTLLMWSHPQADTGRKPLVFLRRPVSVVEAKGINLNQEKIQMAIGQALKNADVRLDEIGYLVTDFGVGKPGDQYLGGIGNALAQLSDDSEHGIQLIMHRTDLTASLGDIGANTAGFSALCAAWAAFSHNKPSLLVGRPAPNRIDVLIFKPRENHVPPARDKLYYGSVSEPEFSRPWWGERLDGQPDFGDEPGKQRADGLGPLKPEGAFEFTWQ